MISARLSKMITKMLLVTLVTLSLIAGTSAQGKGNKYGHNKQRTDFSAMLCSPMFREKLGLSDEQSDFEMERIPQIRQFVGADSFDVGTCPQQSCQYSKYNFKFCPEDGYVCPLTKTKTVVGFYGEYEYEYVDKCVCCQDEGIPVIIGVVDSETGDPLEEIRIEINSRFAGVTEDDGILETAVRTAVKFVIVAEDNEGEEYLNAVKIVDIPSGFRGPVLVEVEMIKKAEPVEIDSRELSTLSLSSDPSDAEAGNAQIMIEPNSFKLARGFGSRRPYRGTVKASVTFVNDDSSSTGRFQTSVGEGEELENLITDGVAAFVFTDPNGNPLEMINPARFIVRKDMRVWNLNEGTGLWEPTGVVASREKRQVTLTDEYLVDIANGQWVNIDKIPGAPRCYFKARIFDATSGTEIPSSTTASFRPGVLAYTNLNQRLRLYPGYTSSPSDTCFEVRCPDVANPDDALTGFINMTSVESISIGGVLVPFTTYLTPRNLAGYIPPIQARHSAVQYAIAPNGLDVFVNFVDDPAAGPFYTTENACENSPVQQPAFHFFKPALPSYMPGPDDTDICTARITFGQEGSSFFNYISELTNLPNMTGISVWEENGSNYYFTDTVQLQFSNDTGNPIVSACLSYRCSEEDELTTVYLDVLIPNDTQTDPTGQQDKPAPAFYCFGSCFGALCHNSNPDASQQSSNNTSIDGSFEAPVDIASSSGYYTSTNDCEDETVDYAYQFVCYHYNRNGSGGEPAKK